MTQIPGEKIVAGLSCRQVLELVSDYLDDELARDVRERVEQHLRGCEACARFGGELGATIRALRAHLEREDRMPEALRERLLGALDRDE